MNYDYSQAEMSQEDEALLAQLAAIGSVPDETADKASNVVHIENGPAGPGGPINVADDTGAIELDASVSAEELTPLVLPLSIDTSLDIARSSAKSKTLTMPEGYALFGDGIYLLPADDKSDLTFICSPLRVDATFADQQGRGWGCLVSVLAPDGLWHEISVTKSDLLRRPNEVLATLVDHGLELAEGKEVKKHVVALLKAWKPDQHLQTVKRMGWTDQTCSSFVIGTSVIGGALAIPVPSLAATATSLTVAGSLEDWKTNVGEKCICNPLMILAVSLAFSGPLLSPLDLSGGGLHFRGTSSSGKTTLLNIAASVWGGRNLISQWRATSNGLEAIATGLNDMLLPLDEIAEISGRNLHEAIYMLANGTSKARMNRTATLTEQTHWKLALISSGEISVEEKLKEARIEMKAGQEVRLIDIEADTRTFGVFDHIHGARNAATFADALQTASRNHHGAVGRVFIEKLVGQAKPLTQTRLIEAISNYAQKWIEKLPSAADGQISRVAKRFALIGLAGEQATSFDLTGWQQHAALQAAEAAFLDWYDRRYGSKREAVETYVKALQGFLTSNLAAMPDVAGPHNPPTNPAGWKNATQIFLTSETWSKIFPANDNIKAGKALLDMDMLIAGEEGRLTRKAPRTIPGRPRLYTVNIIRVMAYKAA